jgi:hypothetical protein
MKTAQKARVSVPIVVGVLAGILGGALSLWLIQANDARNLKALKANALCVLGRKRGQATFSDFLGRPRGFSGDISLISEAFAGSPRSLPAEIAPRRDSVPTVSGTDAASRMLPCPPSFWRACPPSFWRACPHEPTEVYPATPRCQEQKCEDFP